MEGYFCKFIIIKTTNGVYEEKIKLTEEKSKEAMEQKENEIRAIQEKNKEDMKRKEAEIHEMEKRNREDVRKMEENYQTQLRLQKERIDDLNASMEIHVAEAVDKAFKVASKKPLHAKPIKMIPPQSPEELPSKIKRIKSKARLGTKKPDFVYSTKATNKKPRQTRVTKTQQKEVDPKVVIVDDYIAKPPVTRRLMFTKTDRVWHLLDKTIQDKIKLINNKAPG